MILVGERKQNAGILVDEDKQSTGDTRKRGRESSAGKVPDR